MLKLYTKTQIIAPVPSNTKKYCECELACILHCREVEWQSMWYFAFYHLWLFRGIFNFIPMNMNVHHQFVFISFFLFRFIAFCYPIVVGFIRTQQIHSIYFYVWLCVFVHFICLLKNYNSLTKYYFILYGNIYHQFSCIFICYYYVLMLRFYLVYCKYPLNDERCTRLLIRSEAAILLTFQS